MRFSLLILFTVLFGLASQAKDTRTCKKRLLNKAEDLCTKSISIYSKKREKGMSKKAAKKAVGAHIRSQMLKTCKRSCGKGTKVACDEFKGKAKKSFKFCADFYDELEARLKKISFDSSDDEDDAFMMDLLYSSDQDETPIEI